MAIADVAPDQEIKSLADGEKFRIPQPTFEPSCCLYGDTDESLIKFGFVGDPEDLHTISTSGIVLDLTSSELEIHPYDLKDGLLQFADATLELWVAPYYENFVNLEKTDLQSLTKVNFILADLATLEASLTTTETETEAGSSPTPVEPVTVSDAETVDVFTQAKTLLDNDIGAIYVTSVGSTLERQMKLIEKMKKDDNFGDNLVLTTNLGNASSFITLDLADAELSISPDSVD